MAATSFDSNSFRNLPKDPDFRGAKLRDLLGTLFDERLSALPHRKRDSPLIKAIDSALKTRPEAFSGFIFAIVDALQKANQGALARSLFAEGKGHWFFLCHTADAELLLRLIPKGEMASELEQRRIASVVDRLRTFNLREWALETDLEERLPPLPMDERRAFRIWMVRGNESGRQAVLALLRQGEGAPHEWIEEMGPWRGEELFALLELKQWGGVPSLDDNQLLFQKRPELWHEVAQAHPELASELFSSAPLEPALFAACRRLNRADLFRLLTRRPIPQKRVDLLIQEEWETFCHLGEGALQSHHGAWLRAVRPALLSLLRQGRPIHPEQLSQMGDLTVAESIALLSKNPAAWRRSIVAHPESAKILFASEEFALEQEFFFSRMKGWPEQEQSILRDAIIAAAPRNSSTLLFLFAELDSDVAELVNDVPAALSKSNHSQIGQLISFAFQCCSGQPSTGLFCHLSSQLSKTLPKLHPNQLPPAALIKIIEEESTALSILIKRAESDEAHHLLSLHSAWLGMILNHPACVSAQKSPSWPSSFDQTTFRDAVMTLDLIEAGTVLGKELLPGLVEGLHTLLLSPSFKEPLPPQIERLWKAIIHLSDQESIDLLTHSVDLVLACEKWPEALWSSSLASLIRPLLRRGELSPYQPNVMMQIIQSSANEIATPLLRSAIEEAKTAVQEQPSLTLFLFDWHLKTAELLGDEEREQFGLYLFHEGVIKNLSSEEGGSYLRQALYQLAFKNWIKNGERVQQLLTDLLEASRGASLSIRWEVIGYLLFEEFPIEGYLQEGEVEPYHRARVNYLSYLEGKVSYESLEWEREEEHLAWTVAIASKVFSERKQISLPGTQLRFPESKAGDYYREAVAHLSHCFIQLNNYSLPEEKTGQLIRQWSKLLEAPDPSSNASLIVFTSILFNHLGKLGQFNTMINMVQKASRLNLYKNHPSFFRAHLHRLLTQGFLSLKGASELILTVAPLFSRDARGQLLALLCGSLKIRCLDQNLLKNVLKLIRDPKEFDISGWQRRRCMALLTPMSSSQASSSNSHSKSRAHRRRH